MENCSHGGYQDDPEEKRERRRLLMASKLSEIDVQIIVRQLLAEKKKK